MLVVRPIELMFCLLLKRFSRIIFYRNSPCCSCGMELKFEAVFSVIGHFFHMGITGFSVSVNYLLDNLIIVYFLYYTFVEHFF